MDSTLYSVTASRYVNAAIMLILSLILARLADFFITKFLKEITKKTKTKYDDLIISYLHKPIFFTILFGGIGETLYYLAPPERYLFYSISGLKTVVVLIWAIAIFKISGIMVQGLSEKITSFAGLEKEIIPLIENIAKATVIISTIFVILGVWKKDVTPLLASAGIAGFAVAFAAKDTIANFFGGISVFMDRPYKIGDYIILDSGERGEVVAIGLRSTKILTRDEVLISIPNSIMANSKIINESAPIPRFRVRIPIGVAYGSDVDKVERILEEIAINNKYVVKNPAPRVRFRRFGDSALEFELLVWVIEPKYKGRAVHQINKEIHRRFAEEGIEIPYPKRDIYIRREE